MRLTTVRVHVLYCMHSYSCSTPGNRDVGYKEVTWTLNVAHKSITDRLSKQQTSLKLESLYLVK